MSCEKPCPSTFIRKKVFSMDSKPKSNDNEPSCYRAQRQKMTENLLQKQIDDFVGIENVPYFSRGQLSRMLDVDLDDSDSSFHSEIPESEQELLSSSFCESDADDYIPPLTTTKNDLIDKLVAYQPDECDDYCTKQRKLLERNRAIYKYHAEANKRRFAKAYKRLKIVRDLGLENTEREGFILEKMEVKDKKLNRSFYYEENEPPTYKRLLRKRRRAIKRKFELYALDECFRQQYEERIEECANNLFRDALAEADNVYDDISDNTYNLEEAQCIEKQEEDEQHINDLESSFYDTDIPESELEFLSTDLDCELEVPFPGPRSRRRNRLNKLLNGCNYSCLDDEEIKAQKLCQKAEIEAEFKNFCHKRKSLKSLTRLIAVEKMCLPKDEETEQLLNMEMFDKKLHKNYYYTPKEPERFTLLHAKRRRALSRKYEKYNNNEYYRNKLKDKAMVEAARIQDGSLFEDPESDSNSDSSFNDSEIPSSEEEFMSDLDFELPKLFHKPITRSKVLLFTELEKYEPDIFNDTPSQIALKRQSRLEVIDRFRDILQTRRQSKAVKRLKEAYKSGSKDPAILAEIMQAMELEDKKLHKCYFYGPMEPIEYSWLRAKRIRAIHRKYEAYSKFDNFKKQMEYRILSSYKRPKREILADKISVPKNYINYCANPNQKYHCPKVCPPRVKTCTR